MTTPESLLAHAGFVRAVARSLVSDENRVDDIVQETWLAALKSPPRHRRSIRAWLATIAVNATRSTARSDGRRAKRELRVARPESLPSTADIVDSRAMIRLVVDAVDTLDEPYASTVILRYYEDLSPGEIARRQEIPVETVRTRLKRANHRMRKYLDGKFDGDRKAWALALAPLLRPGIPTVADAGGSNSGPGSDPTGPAVSGPGVGATILGGPAAKLGITIALLVVLIVGFRWISRPSEVSPNEGEASPESSRAIENPDVSGLSSDRVDSGGLADASGPSVGGDPVEAFDRPGSLEVFVSWNDEGEPAAGVRAAVGGADLVESLGVPFDHVTDENGRFIVEDLPPGMAIVHFDRISGFGYSEIESDTRSELSISLPPGATLVGRITDSAGMPVEGAEVYLCRQPWDPGTVLARTDERGEYRARAVSVGGYLGARANGHLPVPSRGLPPKIIRELRFDFELADAFGTLVGSVLDDADEPVEDARVSFRPVRSEDSTRLNDGTQVFSPPAIRVETSRDGRFEYAGFERGKVLVSVSSAGFQRWVGEVDFDDEDRIEMLVRLSRGTALEGIVHDEVGDPVAGARIQVKVPGEGMFEELVTESDAQGLYRFEHLVSGTITVRADGRRNRGIAMTTMEIAGQETITWDPILETGRVILGRVIDEEGRALVGYEVFAGAPSLDVNRFYLDPTMHDFSWMRATGESDDYFDLDQLSPGMLRRFRKSAITDAQGSFRIANCEDRAYILEAYEPDASVGQPCAWVDGVVPDGNEIVLRVRSADLPRAYVIGRVVTSSGEPMAGVSIRARSPFRQYWRAETVTREDGTFRCGPLQAIDYFVSLESDDGGRRALASVRLDSGEVRDVGDVRIDRSGALEIRLRRNDGGAIGLPRVWLFDPTRMLRVGVLLEGDTIRADDLSPGPYLLCVQGKSDSRIGWAEYPIDVRPGRVTRDTVEVREGVLRSVRILPPAGFEYLEGKLRLEVLDSFGTLVATRSFRRTTVQDRIAVDVILPPGSYRFAVKGEGLHADVMVEFPNPEEPGDSARTAAPIEIRLRD